jgi:putative spermidine/putrescine transport system ATP-binding protein/putrescine transport system ATP-binding protein
MLKGLALDGVTKRFGEVTALDRVSFDVEHGRTVALLGPSGCGKTTTLRLIAGFETPDEGKILVADEDMRACRAYERNVGLLFQDYALFPHMSVEENIAYGLRFRGLRGRDSTARVREMLALVKLSGLEKRRPSQLSGGQQQRVALARALAINPAVILLDEPLSALDAKLRQELRVELKQIISAVGTTTIVVTHDQEEAMGLAEQIIVMDRGRIMQKGSPVEIYTRPANKFVAEFVGRSNWFRGELEPCVTSGRWHFRTDDGLVLSIIVDAPVASKRRYELCVRPERIVLVTDARTQDAESHPNTIAGRIIDAVHLGPDVHRFVELSSGHRIATVEKHTGQALGQVGDAVTVMFRAEDAILVAEESD